MLIPILNKSWPLFFGLALIMVGNGLQGTLLGVRASIEDFNTTATGLMMSLYYLGFMAGSIYAPKLVSSVGHIRVFTALASLASATVLLHGLFVDIYLWTVIRFFTGFSYAGLYIVVESWLNNASTNKTRGKILSIYQVISFGGIVLGQFLLNIADPSGITLFAFTSVLVSFALIPISLSSRPAPDFDEPETISLRRLFIMSPLGIAGCFGVGIGSSLVFGFGGVYAASIGLSVAQIASFIAAYMIGGVVFQIPIGWVSDQYDRRKIMIIISLLSCLAAVGCFYTEPPSSLFYLFFFLLGGFSLSIYGQSLAHTNDHISEKQQVAAGSTLILINGAGAALGPVLVSIFLDLYGFWLYFPITAAIFGALFAYGLVRTFQRAPVPLEEQSDAITMPARSSPVVLTIMEESDATMKAMNEEEKKS
ncbi:MAG: MFS transporter [Pseudomonadota bacterium]